VANFEIILRPDPTAVTNDIVINNLGNAGEPITNLLPFGDGLLVFKSSCVYLVSYDPGTDTYTSKQIIDYAWGRHLNNGRGAVEFNGSVYFNVLQAVYEYNGTSIRSVGPDLGATEAGIAEAGINGVIQVPPPVSTGQGLAEEKRGTVVRMTREGNWLYGVVDPADYTAVGVTSTPTIVAYAGTGWHELSQWTTDAPNLIAFQAKTKTTGVLSTPTLWFSKGSTVGYLKLAAGTDDRWDYTAVDFEDSFTPQLVTSWFDVELPELYKDWLYLYVDADCPNTSTAITVRYQVNFADDMAWQELGDISVGQEPLRLPYNQSYFGQTLRVRSIRFRFDWTGTASAAARLRGFYCRLITRPPARYGWRMQVPAQDLLDLINQTQSTLTSEAFSLRLQELRERSGPIKFDDGRAFGPTTNYLQNPGLEGWTNSTTPINWSAYNGGILARERVKTFQGQSAVSVLTTNSGRGIESANTAMILAAGSYHAVARIMAVVDNWTVAVVENGTNVVASKVTMSIPANSQSIIGLSGWQRVVIPFTANGTSTYRLRVTSNTANPLSNPLCYLDACEIRDGDDDSSPFIGYGEPRCFAGTGTPAVYSDYSYRPPYWLVYISGISETYRNSRIQLDEDGDPELVWTTVFLVELREAW